MNNPFEGLTMPVIDRPGTPRAEIVDVRMTYAHAMQIKDRIRRGQPVDADARRMAEEVVRSTRQRQLAEAGMVEAEPEAPAPAPALPPQAVAAAPEADPLPLQEDAETAPAEATAALGPARTCRDCLTEPTMFRSFRCRACYLTNRERKRQAKAVQQAPAPAPAHPPKLHVIREHTLQDIPAVLRSIAAQLANGDFGQVGGAVVVLDGIGLEVFYAGTGEAAPNAHLLLHAGAAKMMHAVMAGKVGE
jgi:hypothetical protein